MRFLDRLRALIRRRPLLLAAVLVLVFLGLSGSAETDFESCLEDGCPNGEVCEESDRRWVCVPVPVITPPPPSPPASPEAR